MDSLADLDHRNEYILYSDTHLPVDAQPGGWRHRLVPRSCRLPGFGLAWPFLDGARSARSDNLDAYLGLASVMPGFLGKSVRRVVMIYDVMWRICPDLMRPRARWSMRTLVENSIRRADRILVNTRNTEEHLRAILKIPQSRITVVPLGVDLQRFSPLDPVICRSRVKERYGVQERYILAVGSVNPRKNLVTLLEGYKLLRREGASGLQLVIVGAKEWGNSELTDAMHILGLAEDDVAFLGYIPDDEMSCLYSGADVFVFPSLFEGFGLPLLEAMACGTPVVASDNSSFPEVGGDAAIYVPPHSSDNFASAIKRLLQDSVLRGVMIKKGLERVKTLTWDNTAWGVLHALEG